MKCMTTSHLICRWTVHIFIAYNTAFVRVSCPLLVQITACNAPRSFLLHYRLLQWLIFGFGIRNQLLVHQNFVGFRNISQFRSLSKGGKIYTIFQHRKTSTFVKLRLYMIKKNKNLDSTSHSQVYALVADIINNIKHVCRGNFT